MYLITPLLKRLRRGLSWLFSKSVAGKNAFSEVPHLRHIMQYLHFRKLHHIRLRNGALKICWLCLNRHMPFTTIVPKSFYISLKYGSIEHGLKIMPCTRSLYASLSWLNVFRTDYVELNNDGFLYFAPIFLGQQLRSRVHFQLEVGVIAVDSKSVCKSTTLDVYHYWENILLNSNGF